MERTVTIAVTTGVMTADSPCEDGIFACNSVPSAVMAGVLLAALCCCASCCALSGAVWWWRRHPRSSGDRYVAAIRGRCKYRRDCVVASGVRKLCIRWELDLEALAVASCSSTDPRGVDHHHIGDTSYDEEVGCGAAELVVRPAVGGTSFAQASFKSAANILSLVKVHETNDEEEADSFSATGSSLGGAPSSSGKPVLRSGRHLERDSFDENPLANVCPAYSHGSPGEYYSCTHRCWTRGTVTLDAVDHHVGGVQKMVAVVPQSRAPARGPHRSELHVETSGDQEEPAGEDAPLLPAGTGGQ